MATKKKTTTIPRPKPTKLPVPTATATAPVAGSRAAYEQHLAAAEALAAASVQSFHGDASIVYSNVLVGTRSVIAGKPVVGGMFTEEDLATIVALPEIALGLLFAAIQARPQSSKNVVLDANIKEAMALRRMLLSSAGALADAGIFQEGAVAAIRKGHGSLDAARDLIALGALFNANPGSLDKTPVTPAQLSRAEELGTDLQSQLTSTLAPKRATVNTAVNTRDRFWTLLLQGYDCLWRAGAMLFGEAELSSKVPALLSVARKKTVASKAKAAAKTAADATAKAAKAATRAASVKPKPVKKPKKKK